MFKEFKKGRSEGSVLFDFMGASISYQSNKIRKEKRKHNTRRKKPGRWLSCLTAASSTGGNRKVFLSCIHICSNIKHTQHSPVKLLQFINSSQKKWTPVQWTRAWRPAGSRRSTLCPPCMAVPGDGTCTAAPVQVGFLARGGRSQATSSPSPIWTESIELEKRDPLGKFER